MNSQIPQSPSADRPADRKHEQLSLVPTIGADVVVSGDDSKPFPMTNEPTPDRPSNRLGTLSVQRLSHLVNQRDLAILESVRQHRLINTRHLYELHFWNHASYASGIRACTRVLARLEAHRFIRRIARSQGGHGGGSASTIWALDVAGDRLLRRSAGDQGRSRNFEPSLTFLDHTLTIADVRVGIQQAARAGAFELLVVETEPESWRSYAGQLGAEAIIKPDLYVVTATDDYEDHWFIEVDLGTESVSTLRRKLDAYRAYRASGREQARNDVFPRVVWLAPNAKRALVIQSLVAESERALFVTTTIDRTLYALGATNLEAPSDD